MASDTDAIVARHYMGAYGPTLLLITRTHGHLEILRGHFEKLARGQSPAIRIVAGGPWEFDGLAELAMETVEHALPGARRAGDPRTHDVRIEWRMARDGWEHCLWLLDGLVTTGEPGHQYLTEERDDRVLVVLSFREYRR